MRPDRGANERHRVDTGIHGEPAILFQQERIHQRRRDLLQRHPQPVLIVAGARDAQQLAVGRPDTGGQREARAQRRVRPQPARGEQQRPQGGGLRDPVKGRAGHHGLALMA